MKPALIKSKDKLRKISFGFFLLTSISSTSLSAEPGFAVVELFTSEGCSSCPPAEAYLNELSKLPADRNIFPLAFHVDYWDYIGWKDPFAKREHSNRQRNYVEKTNSDGVYTPQIILNGKYDIVGSDSKAVERAVGKEQKIQSESSIRLEADYKSDGIKVFYNIQNSLPGQKINVALIEKELNSQVTRGENSGRSLKHLNVVRAFETIDAGSKTGNIKIRYPIAKDSTDRFAIIAYLQDDRSMKINAAARTSIKKEF